MGHSPSVLGNEAAPPNPVAYAQGFYAVAHDR